MTNDRKKQIEEIRAEIALSSTNATRRKDLKGMLKHCLFLLSKEEEMTK